MKVGSFKFSRDLLDVNPLLLLEVIYHIKFIPTSVYYDEVYEIYIYTGLSDIFTKRNCLWNLQVTQKSNEIEKVDVSLIMDKFSLDDHVTETIISNLE